MHDSPSQLPDESIATVEARFCSYPVLNSFWPWSSRMPSSAGLRASVCVCCRGVVCVVCVRQGPASGPGANLCVLVLHGKTSGPGASVCACLCLVRNNFWSRSVSMCVGPSGNSFWSWSQDGLFFTPHACPADWLCPAAAA